jgi:hypothetical protein
LALSRHLVIQDLETLFGLRLQSQRMHLSIMAKNAVQHLQSQIPALSLPLYLLKKSDALNVMEKRADVM